MNKISGDFSNGLAAANAAKAAQKAATSAKNANKRAAKTLIAQYAKTWRADLSIPDSVLDSMMVPNHQSQGTKTPPSQPLNLSMKINSVGVVTLKWDKNGNKSGTIYNVETTDSATGVWATFDVTTKSRMDYPGTPGVEVWVRVSAKRNGQTSSYSLAVSLWARVARRSIWNSLLNAFSSRSPKGMRPRSTERSLCQFELTVCALAVKDHAEAGLCLPRYPEL